MTNPLYPADYGKVAPGGHCGVLAVAIFAGRTFEEAWAALAPKRGRWSGGTRHGDRVAALRSWGIPLRTVLHLPAHECSYWQGRSPLLTYDASAPRCSVATFARRHAKPGVTYMLRVSRHVVTLRDGIVIDQTQAAPAASHWTAKKIVTVSVESL